MRKTLKLLTVVSRPEFLPANSASIVIGVSWGITLPVDMIWGFAVPISLLFAIITLVAAFAAQVNTVSDYEIDLKDNRKKKLVEAMHELGENRLRPLMAAELVLSLALLAILLLLSGKLALMVMWVAAVFLAHAYSAPPLRLKSRSWFAVVTLLLVLSILPITFVFHAFASQLDPVFLLFLVGQAFTVYGVIIPAEIRDYFTDKAMGIETMTVRLGLVKASLSSITLLGAGGLLCGAGFLLKLASSPYPTLTILLAVMIATYAIILRKYVKLYLLSREYIHSKAQDSAAQNIEELSANNPQWITLITQTIVFMSLVLLASKLLP